MFRSISAIVYVLNISDFFFFKAKKLLYVLGINVIFLQQGLCHISELSSNWLAKAEDVS